jgi:uncharacterized protein YhaN
MDKTEHLREEIAQMRKDLMVMQADYRDLEDRMRRWNERFFALYQKIDNLND